MQKRIEEEDDRRDEFLITRNPRVLFGPKKFFCSKLGKCEIMAFDFPKLEAPQVLSRIGTKNCHVDYLHG